MAKVREDSGETEGVMIRPKKSLVAWYQKRAAREMLENGRSVTPNKLMVEDLEEKMAQAHEHEQSTEGAKRK